MAMGEAITYGWLRPEVQVTYGDAGDSIRFAHWEVRVPRGALAGRTLQSVLTRENPIQCPQDDPELAGLLALLDAQGCFRRVGAMEACSMRELRRRFDRLRSVWYAAYYAHPLWERLRRGKASRNELLAWVIHNYHISRVAGASAARCASRPYTRNLRTQFLKDTFDEYWHVDSFYFVRHPSLAIHDEDVKRYVPLPGSRAFELHTMQVADRNPLGHLLIAYFQESTAVFIDDCVSFYRDVERAYSLNGFFDTWVAHMRLDVDQRHADSLSQLFENDLIVSADEQLAAFRCAYLAYSYLLASLDQVLEQARTDEFLDIRAPHDFVTRRQPIPTSSHVDRSGNQTAELQASALHASLACLGRTLEHDDVMSIGRLCRTLHTTHTDAWLDCKVTIWSEALSHLLQEQSESPASLATLLRALELRFQEHGLSYLSSDSLDTVDKILIRHGGSNNALLSLAVSERMAIEFLDLALCAPLIDSGAYSP